MTEQEAKDELPDFKGVEVIRTLGEGSYGAVYEVNYEGKERALKVYKGNVPDIIEIDTLSRIRHPNIIPVLKVLNGKDFGIIMPLGDMDLFDYLQTPRSLDTRINILYKIVSAVDFLLEQNILPFDLHSGNVVMMGDEPLIIDTGVARRVDCRGSTINSPHPFMALQIRPRENVRSFTQYSEASIVWGLGILSYNILSSGYSAKYPEDLARKLGITDEVEKYTRWTDLHFRDSTSIRNIYKTKVRGVEDEKQLDMITDLAMGMLDSNLEERFTMKDILQHPLFSEQKSYPMGTVISSDFTLYPEMEEDVKVLVKAMLDDITKEGSSEMKLLPSSAIFGAVYVYQRFVSVYGKSNEYRIVIPLQLMYYLYGFKDLTDFVPSIISDEGKGLPGIDDYTRDIVAAMEGIIHPITDYDKAFTKLAEIFPTMLELDISTCPKPAFDDMAKAILDNLYYIPLEKKLPEPLYYKLTRYVVNGTLENVKSLPRTIFSSSDVTYYRYGDTYSKMSDTIRNLFGRILVDPAGGFDMYYYDDLSRVSDDIVDNLFNNPQVKRLSSQPDKVVDGEIAMIVLWQ